MVCKELGFKPYSFKKPNGEYYVAYHHIIPVLELKEGVLGFTNIITVCANHYRQFHYGNVELIKNTDKEFAFKIDNKSLTIKKLRFSGK